MKQNQNIENFNKMLEADKKNLHKYCYHCNSSNPFKSTIAVTENDQFNNKQFKCIKCGKVFPETVLNVEGFLNNTASIYTNMEALVEQYKFLISCLPQGKINSSNINDIEELINVSDKLNDIYTKCESLADKIIDTELELSEDSLLHQRAFYYNHPEY